MPERTVKHEVKLQKSVIVILAIMAFGLCANAFAPVFSINDATAQVSGMKVLLGSIPGLPIDIRCDGCN